MADEGHTFEQTKSRLEEILGEVKKKDTSLEKSIELLEEGVRLANRCNELIDRTSWEESPDGAEEGSEGDAQEGGSVGEADADGGGAAVEAGGAEAPVEDAPADTAVIEPARAARDEDEGGEAEPQEVDRSTPRSAVTKARKRRAKSVSDDA